MPLSELRQTRFVAHSDSVQSNDTLVASRCEHTRSRCCSALAQPDAWTVRSKRPDGDDQTNSHWQIGRKIYWQRTKKVWVKGSNYQVFVVLGPICGVNGLIDSFKCLTKRCEEGSKRGLVKRDSGFDLQARQERTVKRAMTSTVQEDVNVVQSRSAYMRSSVLKPQHPYTACDRFLRVRPVGTYMARGHSLGFWHRLVCPETELVLSAVWNERAIRSNWTPVHKLGRVVLLVLLGCRGCWFQVPAQTGSGLVQCLERAPFRPEMDGSDLPPNARLLIDRAHTGGPGGLPPGPLSKANGFPEGERSELACGHGGARSAPPATHLVMLMNTMHACFRVELDLQQYRQFWHQINREVGTDGR